MFGIFVANFALKTNMNIMELKMNIDLATKYLNKSSTITEKKVFENWLNKSHKNVKQFHEFRKNRELIFRAYKNYEPDVKQGWRNVYEKIHDVPAKKKSIEVFIARTLKAAGIVFILALIVFISYRITDSYLFYRSGTTTYVSGNKIKQIILVDGTEVWLNSFSELKASQKFNNRKRKVKLSGEAFFDVQEVPGKIFEIITDNTVTKVLGTSLNIRSYNNENHTVITVNSGKVAFRIKNIQKEIIYITAGDKAVYNNKSKKIIKTTNNDPNYMSWKTGKLEFRSSPLPNILRSLSRHYHINFTADNDKIKDYLYTGSFQDKSLEQTLEILELTLNIKFYKSGNNIQVAVENNTPSN